SWVGRAPSSLLSTRPRWAGAVVLVIVGLLERDVGRRRRGASDCALALLAGPVFLHPLPRGGDVSLQRGCLGLQRLDGHRLGLLPDPRQVPVLDAVALLHPDVNVLVEEAEELGV